MDQDLVDFLELVRFCQRSPRIFLATVFHSAAPEYICDIFY